MISKLKNLALEPYPLRHLAIRLARLLGRDSFDFKLRNNLHERPSYAYILYEGALLARRLGIKRVSAVEFGVAGGSGLVAMERLAEQIERQLPVEFEIYGFDTGAGLPAPQDYRDLPYHWKEGFFKMDVPALQSRLRRAKLVLGDVRDTAGTFFSDFDPAPIVAISHDFDYYSSTAAALKMFNGPEKYFLPRIFCYFDDTLGDRLELYNEYTGQRGAINEFNREHDNKKLCPPVYLLARPFQEPWYRQIFVYHHFSHSKYCTFISTEDQQLRLDPR
jgi:hypothetical protein